MDFKSILKTTVPHIIAIAAMIFVSSVYFYPAWEGETLRRDDIVKDYGSRKDVLHARKYEHKSILWQPSLFSGMPDYVGTSYPSSSKLKRIYNYPVKLGIPQEVNFIIWYMLGFYILLIALGANPWLSLAGALAFGLTSYNLIIINAGHFKKVRTLAYIAPVLAGVLLTYRKKYLLGFVLTAFFLALQIAHDHIQMSYYFMLGLVCIGMVELYNHIKENHLSDFIKASTLLIIAALVAIGPNYSKLSNLYRYNKQTIRGKSELTEGKKGVKTESGLDRDYINAWSSGRSESMMLFAPKVKGGASAYVKQDRELLKHVDPRMRETIGNMNQYWGDQGGSGGPNTAGAVIVFLFIIGLFIIKGPMKQGILVSVILFILLSWGKHFSIFTDIFIDYVPLYNKFRTPVSILAIAVIFITFFAFYTLSKLIKNPELLSHNSKLTLGKKPVPMYMAAGLGFILFLLLNLAFPQLFNRYLNDQEIALFDNYRAQGGANQIDAIVNALTSLRIYVFRTEFFRTLVFAVLTLASIYLFKTKKIKANTLIALIGILSIIDVWTIGQRYVNKDDFTKQNLIENEYRLTDIDKQIFAREIQNNPDLEQKINEAYGQFQPKNQAEQEDIQKYIIQKNTFYRVYDLTTAAFQDNGITGTHRSIGGYHAAKLRRYQDLIERQISKGNMQVLNMLNTKYFITQNGLQINPSALGAAWFVGSVIWADSPDEEMEALNNFNAPSQVVLNTKDKSKISPYNPPIQGDTITVESREPDHITYSSQTSGDRIAVFSEVYYPDWTVLIDGHPAECVEGNYILRVLHVPGGQHKIEFIFNPPHYTKANSISMIFYYLIMALVLIIVGLSVYRAINKQDQSDVKA